MDLTKRQILGVGITTNSKTEILAFVTDYLQKKSAKPLTIFTPNPEQLALAHKNNAFKNLLNSADIAIPDGFGLKLAVGKLTIIKGRELMVDLFVLANDLGLRVYILGSTKEVNDKVIEKVHMFYPKAKIRGWWGPKLDDKGNAASETDEHNDFHTRLHIDKFNPDILLVGFGAPKQEFWVANLIETTRVSRKIPIIMVVGGALDTFSGIKKAPPKLFESLGLEWLWRLIQEPWRLGRQLRLIKYFLLVIKEKFVS